MFDGKFLHHVFISGNGSTTLNLILRSEEIRVVSAGRWSKQPKNKTAHVLSSCQYFLTSELSEVTEADAGFLKRGFKCRQELRGGRYRTCIGQSQQTVKYSSMAPGSRCVLEGHVKDNYHARFQIRRFSDVEKTKLRCKNFQSQWTVKYRSRATG